MSLTDLLHNKNEAREFLKTQYSFPKRSKILIALNFGDTKITKKIIEGLSILPANFIIFEKNTDKIKYKNIVFETDILAFDMTGVDAILGDCESTKIEKIMEMGVVPLMNEKNYLGKILHEYHPGRAEGNAYLYEKGSHWSAYYALIRYLENHRFPYDNRNLVKNVVGI